MVKRVTPFVLAIEATFILVPVYLSRNTFKLFDMVEEKYACTQTVLK